MKLLKLDLNNFRPSLGNIEKNDTTELEIKLLENIDYTDYKFRLIAKINTKYLESILDENNSKLENNILSINLDKKFVNEVGLIRLELNMCKDNLESTTKEFYFCISDTFNAEIIESINSVDTLAELEKYIDYSTQEIEKIKLELESISLEKLIEIRDRLEIENNRADRNVVLLDAKNNLAIENLSLLDAKNLLAAKNIEDLNKTIVSSATSKTALENTINSSTTAKTVLDNSISNSTIAKTNLENVINTANTSKSTLDSSVKTANTTKTTLDNSVNNANNKKNELDSKITDATLKINTLDSKNSLANTNIVNLENCNTIAENKTNILSDKIVEAENKRVELEEIITTNAWDFGKF